MFYSTLVPVEISSAEKDSIAPLSLQNTPFPWRKSKNTISPPEVELLQSILPPHYHVILLQA